jgi:hypothetical protein
MARDLAVLATDMPLVIRSDSADDVRGAAVAQWRQQDELALPRCLLSQTFTI